MYCLEVRYVNFCEEPELKKKKKCERIGMPGNVKGSDHRLETEWAVRKKKNTWSVGW